MGISNLTSKNWDVASRSWDLTSNNWWFGNNGDFPIAAKHGIYVTRTKSDFTCKKTGKSRSNSTKKGNFNKTWSPERKIQPGDDTGEIQVKFANSDITAQVRSHEEVDHAV